MAERTRLFGDYWTDGKYIVMEDVHLGGVPSQLRYDGDEFYLKPEFHASIINLQATSELIVDSLGGGTPSKVQQGLTDFCVDYLKQTDMPMKLTGEFRVVRREERRSIVAMLEMPKLDQLFDEVRAKYGVENIPTQVAHITIMAIENVVGIGIPSQAELDRLSRPADIPELANVSLSS